MNKEKKTNQGKLPIAARLSRGKVTNKKNARSKTTKGKEEQMDKPPLKITRTIGRGKGRISVTTKRNLITRGGKILRVNRNISLNSGKKADQPLGRKILQTKNVRKSARNRLGPNLNFSNRKVEFDDQNGFNTEAVQDNFMGNVNYGFEPIPAFPQVGLLPTPQIQQRIFPPVLEPFHNNSQNLMNLGMNLEMQNAQNYDGYQEELIALERKRVEEDLREMERKRLEEIERKRLEEIERKRIEEIERKQMEEMRELERKRMEEIKELERKQIEERMFEEEQRRFEEEQKRFEEEQRQFEQEQRMIDKERRNLRALREALEREKQNLEILKQTVEEEEEMEMRRSVSIGREMTNEFVGGFDSNRTKKGNFQNQKVQDNRSNTNSQRGPTAGGFDNVAKKTESRGRFDARENQLSQRMPATGLLDYMLNKSSAGGRGGGRSGERRGMEGNSRDRGGGRGKNSNNSGGGRRGGGNKTSDRGRGGNTNRAYDQSSKFNNSERNYSSRNSSPEPHRTPGASGLMSYMLDTEQRDAPSYSQSGSFNQFDNYQNDFDMSKRRDYDETSRRGEYNDMSRRSEYDTSRRGEYDTAKRGGYDDMARRDESSYSGGNSNSQYSFQRNSIRGDEMTSNQSSIYGSHTQIGYQASSRGFQPFKDEQRTQLQSANNFGSFQESSVGHPYYDDFYDQGRINRNPTENTGRLGSFEKQGTWSGTSFPTKSKENKFGFVGYPFRNKSPILKDPPTSSVSYYSSNYQNLTGFASNNNTNQQEQSSDSFYSYRPGDKQTNKSSKSGKSVSTGIDILGGGTSILPSSSGNAAGSSYGSDFFGKVGQNPNKRSASYSKSNSSKSHSTQKRARF